MMDDCGLRYTLVALAGIWGLKVAQKLRNADRAPMTEDRLRDAIENRPWAASSDARLALKRSWETEEDPDDLLPPPTRRDDRF